MRQHDILYFDAKMNKHDTVEYWNVLREVLIYEMSESKIYNEKPCAEEKKRKLIIEIKEA